jgi:hypothetical protein
MRRPFDVVVWLLHLANSCPPPGLRREFYALKDRLLARGNHVGWDWQHIVDECWDCDGRGWGCARCCNTGVWRERWVALERIRLGAYIFHKPWRSTPIKPSAPVTIEGRIVHASGNGRAAREAGLWLALLFDRRLFVALLRNGRLVRPGWYPLARLQWLLVGALWRWHRVRDAIARHVSDEEIPF